MMFETLFLIPIHGGSVMTFYNGQKWPNRKRKKHKRAQGSVWTTPKQREALAEIRGCLAILGYQMYPVAKWFRRSQYDFVAVPRQNANMLLVVRPGHRHENELLCYGLESSYRHIRNYLDEHAHACGKMVWGKQLPAKDNANDWKLFVPRVYWGALKLFTDA